MLLSGCENGRFKDYPPNCMQFRDICLSYYKGLNLPDVKDAYNEIKRNGYSSRPNWSHPAVKYAASKLPSEFLSIEHEGIAYDLFKKTYAKVCHIARLGFDIPEVNSPVILFKPVNKDIARHHLTRIKQHLGVA